MTDSTKYILSIDQGTTSTRAIVFDHAGQIVSTQPDLGKICSCSCWPVETIWPAWSKTIARVEVVHWSIERMYFVSVIGTPSW